VMSLVKDKHSSLFSRDVSAKENHFKVIFLQGNNLLSLFIHEEPQIKSFEV